MQIYGFKDDHAEHDPAQRPDASHLAVAFIFSVRAEEVPFLAPQQRPTGGQSTLAADRFLVLAYRDVEDDAADQRYLSVRNQRTQ